MGTSPQVSKRPHPQAGVGDEVRLVERAPAMDRHGKHRQAVGVPDIGKASDPGGVELPGKQEADDLLIGSPLHKLHRGAKRRLHVVGQRPQKGEV